MSSPRPSRFPMKRLRRVVTLERSRFTGADSDRPYIGLEAIEPWTGKLIDDFATADGGRSAVGDSRSLNNRFEPGDVLFGKLRPYLAKAWVAEFRGRCTTELLVMRPVDVLSRYLCHVCLSVEFITAVDALTFGSRMPRADWKDIGNLHIPVPSLAEQRAIAAHLVRQTMRLDALADENARMSRLLAERRQALIAAALAGHLNVEDEA